MKNCINWLVMWTTFVVTKYQNRKESDIQLCSWTERYSIVAFMHQKIDWLDWHQKQILANFGFNLGYHSFSPYSWNSIRDTAYTNPMPVNNSTKPCRRRLIELACGHNSALCKYSCVSAGCDCVRYTAENDLFWKTTHERVVAAATSDHV